jgi:hypothetical protein
LSSIEGGYTRAARGIITLHKNLLPRRDSTIEEEGVEEGRCAGRVPWPVLPPSAWGKDGGRNEFCCCDRSSRDLVSSKYQLANKLIFIRLISAHVWVPPVRKKPRHQCRMLPQAVASVTARINPTADTLLSNGLVIPRRTLVWTPLYGLHMSPRNFPDPEKYAQVFSRRTEQGYRLHACTMISISNSVVFLSAELGKFMIFITKSIMLLSVTPVRQL